MVEQALHRRTRLSPTQRRQQLLEVAIAVSASRGLGKAGHSDIAQQAGVAVATVFHYFKTKEVLVAEVVSSVGEFLFERIKDVHEQDLDAQEKLLKHVEEMLSLRETHPNLICVFLEWGANLRGANWPEHLDYQQRILGLLKSTIESGQEKNVLSNKMNSDDAAKLFYSLVQMSLFMEDAESKETDNYQQGELNDKVESLKVAQAATKLSLGLQEHCAYISRCLSHILFMPAHA